MPYYRYKQIMYVRSFISAIVASTCFEILNNRVDNNKHISVDFGFFLFKQNLPCAKSYREVKTIIRNTIVQRVLFYDGEDCPQFGLYHEVTGCI